MHIPNSLVLLPPLALAGVLASVVPVQCKSADYPAKPIRILVALSPGSQVDVLARMIAPKMSENWHQPVVIDNRPGGAGAIAGSVLVNAAPDGHTLMVYSDGHAVNAVLYKEKLPYDTLRDIARVAMIASFSC